MTGGRFQSSEAKYECRDLYLGDPNEECYDGTYVSWWPIDAVNDVMEAISGTPARWYETFESELEDNGNPAETLNMCGLDEENIKAFFKRLLEGSRRWDLVKRSCSNVIYHALCEGSDWFKDRAGETTTPHAVAELVKAYVKGKLDKKIKVAAFCK